MKNDIWTKSLLYDATTHHIKTRKVKFLFIFKEKDAN